MSLEASVMGRYVDTYLMAVGNASEGVKAPVRNIMGVTIMSDSRIAVLSVFENEDIIRPRRTNMTTVIAHMPSIGKKLSMPMSTLRK